MAKQTICSIENCGKQARIRGWCPAHYRRWQRHGNPRLGNAAHGEPKKWLHDHIGHPDKVGCLIWPYSRTKGGYPTTRIRDGKVHVASRLMCQLAHGNPPEDWYEAAHNCGKRDCVNPNHLRWATPTENRQDKIGHGTIARGSKNALAKLTEDQVRHIRSMTGRIVQQRLAEQYGVAPSLISKIQSGKEWAWLK